MASKAAVVQQFHLISVPLLSGQGVGMVGTLRVWFSVRP